MSRKRNGRISEIKTPRRLVKVMLFGHGDIADHIIAWWQIHERFADWCKTPEGARELARVVYDDGNVLASVIWEDIRDLPLDDETLCRIAGGCEVDREVSADALNTLLLRNPPTRTLARLYCTAYRAFTTTMVAVPLTKRLPAPAIELLHETRAALGFRQGLGYFSNTRVALPLEALMEDEDETEVSMTLRVRTGSTPAIHELTDVGLLVMALVGEPKVAACAACQLFMRSNPGDGIHDFAKLLCAG